MPRTTSSQSDSPRPRRSDTRSAQHPSSIEAASDTAAAALGGEKGSSYNPSYDEIAEAAYLRYLRRGASDGQDFDDWVEAERELRSRREMQ